MLFNGKAKINSNRRNKGIYWKERFMENINEVSMLEILRKRHQSQLRKWDLTIEFPKEQSKTTKKSIQSIRWETTFFDTKRAMLFYFWIGSASKKPLLFSKY